MGLERSDALIWAINFAGLDLRWAAMAAAAAVPQILESYNSELTRRWRLHKIPRSGIEILRGRLP